MALLRGPSPCVQTAANEHKGETRLAAQPAVWVF